MIKNFKIVLDKRLDLQEARECEKSVFGNRSIREKCILGALLNRSNMLTRTIGKCRFYLTGSAT